MENTQKPPKIAYEWVLQMSRGEDIILSENQYKAYMRHVQSQENPGMMFFSETAVNPFYVAQIYRRKAQYIKDKYPCKACYQSGRKPDNTDWCEVCGGSGVQLPK